MVENTGDVITDHGDGTDLVQSSVNYTLSPNVNLTLTGSSGLTAAGNKLDH